MNGVELTTVYPLVMSILGYVLQYSICQWKAKLFWRLLPGMALLTGVACCAIPFITDPYSDDLLSVVIRFLLGLGLTGMSMGSIGAWIRYAVVRNRQKRRK